MEWHKKHKALFSICSIRSMLIKSQGRGEGRSVQDWNLELPDRGRRILLFLEVNNLFTEKCRLEPVETICTFKLNSANNFG